jgi:DUF4097 and DUF4098 domain-containing protein YvlB
MRKSSPGTATAALVVAAGLAVAGCDVTVGAGEYRVREERRFSVSGPTQLTLTTFDGSIEVRGWDRNEVLVEVEKSGSDQAVVDRIGLRAAQAGNTITIEAIRPSPITTTGLRRGPGASLVVSVPKQTALSARSGDGSITIRSIAGKVDLETEDGSVHLEDVTGALTARTVDGSIHVRGIDGSVQARTGDGSIGIDGTLSGLIAETNDGSIQISARRGSRADADWEITTGDGSISMDVPEGLSADVEARTGDGPIRVRNLGVPAGKPEGDEDRDGNYRRFQIGGGGKLVRLKTSDGSITIAGPAGR